MGQFDIGGDQSNGRVFLLQRMFLGLRITILIGLFAVVFAPSQAVGQMAGAMGKPLVRTNYPQGQVTVRVFDGAPDKIVRDFSVFLIGNDGKQLIEKTNSEGRATFSGVPAGSGWRAKVGEQLSEVLSMPQQGGIAVMLTTSPWGGAGQGARSGTIAPANISATGSPKAPMGGRPPLRSMTGKVRGDPQVPAGVATVRLFGGSWDRPISGHPVVLVRLEASGQVSKMIANTGEAGRARFSGLDTKGRSSYVAMTTVNSGGVYHRLHTQAFTMPPKVGLRTLLSPESTEEVTDNFQTLSGLPAAPVGQAVVALLTDPVLGGGAPGKLELHRIGVGLIQTIAAKPIPFAGQEQSQFSELVSDSSIPQGHVLLVIRRQTSAGVTPIVGAGLAVTQGENVQKASTEQNGEARVVGFSSGEITLRVTIDGAVYEATRLMENTGKKKGASAGYRIILTVETQEIVGGRFRIAPGDTTDAYYIVFRTQKQNYPSFPFQMVEKYGASAVIFVMPRVSTTFHFGGFVDDKYLGFQGEYRLRNQSFYPYDPGAAGTLLPLPNGFLGGQVEDSMKDRVSVVPGKGLIVRDVLPPGGLSIQTAFSLETENGQGHFSMATPLGATQSNINLMLVPGMEFRVDTPLQGALRSMPNGKEFYSVSPINLGPGGTVSFSVRGLPSHPAWQKKVPTILGLFVLGLLGWGGWLVWCAHTNRTNLPIAAQVRDDKQAKREQVFQQLVALVIARKEDRISAGEFKARSTPLRDQLVSEVASGVASEIALGKEADRSSASAQPVSHTKLSR